MNNTLWFLSYETIRILDEAESRHLPNHIIARETAELHEELEYAYREDDNTYLDQYLERLQRESDKGNRNAKKVLNWIEEVIA